ncbi:MAG: hypothetical protein D6693_07395 [Planctomycetota bacterium]|nr:MAG: hypothetical protein D6693_07395 [Planctomycetota bacterium]
MDDQTIRTFQRIRREAGPYPPEAYAFVQEGLRFTVDGRRSDDDGSHGRHVSGVELCDGLRRYARREFGLLARDVLGHWHIRSTEDFGRIVFAMVEAGLLRTSEEDSMDDFLGVYSFDEAFESVTPEARAEPA